MTSLDFISFVVAQTVALEGSSATTIIYNTNTTLNEISPAQLSASHSRFRLLHLIYLIIRTPSFGICRNNDPLQCYWLSGIDKIVINSTQDLLVGKLVINIQIDIVYVFIGRLLLILYGCSSRGCPGLELAVCGDAPEAGVYGLAGRVGHVVVLGQVPVLVPGDHNIQHLF